MSGAAKTQRSVAARLAPPCRRCRPRARSRDRRSVTNLQARIGSRPCSTAMSMSTSRSGWRSVMSSAALRRSVRSECRRVEPALAACGRVRFGARGSPARQQTLEVADRQPATSWPPSISWPSQHDGETRALPAPVMHLAGERHPADLGAGLGEVDALVAHAEAALQRERDRRCARRRPRLGSLAAQLRNRARLVPRRASSPWKALRVRRVADRAVEGELGAAGQACPQLLEQQHAVGARDLDADAAHGLAAEVRLVEIEAHLGLGLRPAAPA